MLGRWQEPGTEERPKGRESSDFGERSETDKPRGLAWMPASQEGNGAGVERVEALHETETGPGCPCCQRQPMLLSSGIRCEKPCKVTLDQWPRLEHHDSGSRACTVRARIIQAMAERARAVSINRDPLNQQPAMDEQRRDLHESDARA